MADAVYLTKARAQQAVALAEPAILKMMESVTRSKSLHIVVLGLNGEILYDQSVGPDVEADRDKLATCEEVAQRKARIHFRTGRPAGEIQARRPNLLQVDDTIWWGSASHEGIVVGVSGVQSWFDESVAAMVAAILWGLCMDAQAAYMAQTEKAVIYKGPL